MIKKLDHITINTHDLEATVSYYQNVLGCALQSMEERGDGKTAWLELKGMLRVELVQYRMETPTANITNTTACTYRHLAFEVEDIDAFTAHCAKMGAPVLYQPLYDPKSNCMAMLIQDPNGLEIKIIQQVE